MNVVKATRQFEAWLARHTDIDQKDLCLKHTNMKADVFMFLRATYYRWAQLWPEVCPELAKAPQGLALRDPVRFWQRMDALPTLQTAAPVSAIDAIEHLMPAPGVRYRLAHRSTGLGSLGHARYVAIADWHGGRIAREAKALVPSSSYWVHTLEAGNSEPPAEILYQTIVNRAVRCPDPFVQIG